MKIISKTGLPSVTTVHNLRKGKKLVIFRFVMVLTTSGLRLFEWTSIKNSKTHEMKELKKTCLKVTYLYAI